MDIKEEVEDETLDYSIVKEEYCINENANESVKKIGDVLTIKEEVKNEFTEFEETSTQSPAPIPTADKSFKCSECNNFETHTVDVSFPCSICQTPFKSAPSLKKHMSVHRKKRHICEICGKKFFERSNMKRHMQRIHESKKQAKMVNISKTIECPVPNCSKKFKYQHYLTNHMAFHNAEKPFECPKCPRKFKTKYVFAGHMRFHENGGTMLTCAICNKTFQWKKDLRKHMQEHTTRKGSVICSYCFQSICKDYLKTHMEKQHKGLPFMEKKEKPISTRSPLPGTPLKCPQCNKLFGTTSSINRHMQIHKEGMSFPCPICEKPFKTAGYLKHHMVVHGDKPLQCPKCDMSYRTSKAFNRHMQLHKEGMSFPCSICRKPCETARNLKTHMLIHGFNSFQCQQCFKSFGNRSAFNRHMEIHNKVSYPCAICQKPFKTASYLKHHMKVHGDKSFQCEQCDKSYGSRKAINRHMLTHKEYEGMSFLCLICDQSFSTASLLRNHMTIHGKEPRV